MFNIAKVPRGVLLLRVHRVGDVRVLLDEGRLLRRGAVVALQVAKAAAFALHRVRIPEAN